jgi:hypothetical protein
MNQTIINSIFPVLIRDIAAVTSSQVVDVHSAFNSSSLSCDGCHPTAAGNQIIAETIYAQIKKDIAK